MTMISSNLNWNSGYWKDIIKTDGRGYYVYLPAIFIYHDLNLGFFQEIAQKKYYNKNTYFDYRVISNGRIITKYFCGTALLHLPFFFVAHAISHIYGFEPDGYSPPYQVLISISALFYLLIGLVFLRKILILYQINHWNIALTLLAMVFGTNIFYYTVNEPGMSHIYSFAVVSMFLYYGKLYFLKLNKNLVVTLALLFGIIVLIRPVNGLIILTIPFLSGSYQNLKAGIIHTLRHKLIIFISIICFFSIISIQFIIYRISTGSFIVDSYKNEGFLFLNPHMIDILFSYKKGLFLYTPILFISLFGGYYLWKKNRFECYTVFIFLIVLTFVLSSWNNWWYGGSFSSRVFLEYIPLFAILMGIALGNFKQSSFKRIYITLVFLLIIVCQIQIYQYRYYYIHWENMTKEKYWNVFLRVDKLLD